MFLKGYVLISMVQFNDEFKFITVLDNIFNGVEKTGHYLYMNDKMCEIIFEFFS